MRPDPSVNVLQRGSRNCELPGGLVAREVPAATYAVFQPTGEQPDALIATWQRIWTTSIDRTYIGDFEVHEDEGKVEIFVGVR